MAKTYDEVGATRETVQEATDLYNKGGIQITRYSAGRGKLGVQVSTGYQKYIQLTEPQMKTLAQILPKLQRDLRKDLMKKEDLDEALKGDQHKLDHDKDGDIDAKDFAALRNKKKKKKGKEDTAEMNPKLDNGKDDKAEQKESTMVNSGRAQHALQDHERKDHADYMKKTHGVQTKYHGEDELSYHGTKKQVRKALDNHYGKDGDQKYFHPHVYKESTIRDKLIAVLEGDRAAHYKGATKPQDYEEILGTGPGAKKMIDDHKPAPVDPKFDGNVAAKTTAEAGKKTNQSKKRNNDKDQGDKKIVNPVSGAKTESVNNIIKAYESMYEKKDVEEKLTPDQRVARDAGRGKGKAAKDYVKTRMHAAEPYKFANEPTDSDLKNRMHKGAPGKDFSGKTKHDTSARPKDKLASQPDIKTRLKNKKSMDAYHKARKQAQRQAHSPSGRSNMGGVGIRY